jgi:hypothetical protein
VVYRSLLPASGGFSHFLPASCGFLQFSAASNGFSHFSVSCLWFLTVFCLFLLILLLGLILELQDGGGMILRNVGLFPTNTALQPHRPL